MTMKQALVTGSSGFLGRVLLQHLERCGDRLTTMGRRPAAGWEDRHVPLGDCGDGAAIRRIVAETRPDVIYHLAGSAVGSPEALHRINVVYAEHLFEAAAALASAPVMILCGTAAEYGALGPEQLPVRESAEARPQTAYGRTKLHQTRLGLEAAAGGLPVVVPRLFNVIGPGMPEHLALGRFIAQIVRMGAAGGTLVTGSLHASRDFVDVEEAARILEALGRTAAARGQIVNVCTGEPTRLSDVVETLIAVSGKSIAVETDRSIQGISNADCVYGSGERLRALGLSVPPTDFPNLLRRALAFAERHA